jgi:hypothetical protein
MTDEQVRRLLRAACKQAGSQSEWARTHGVPQQVVNAVLNKRRAPGPQILHALGLERTIAATYSRKAPANTE